MDQKQERNRDLRGVSLLLAVIVALMSFSAALATKVRLEPSELADTAPQVASPYEDPSLAGLRVGPDAQANGDVHIYY